MGKRKPKQLPENAGYITQMLSELSRMAEEKDPALLYFIEMAMKHSHEVDLREIEAKASQIGQEAA